MGRSANSTLILLFYFFPKNLLIAEYLILSIKKTPEVFTMDQKTMNVLKVIGIGVGLVAVYKLFLEGKKPKDAVKESVSLPVDVVKDAANIVINTGKKLIKGSPEAKARMKELASKRKHIGRRKNSPQSKGGKATAALGAHKGHKTKKGLSQDQKKSSQEKHEKEYRQKRDHNGFDGRYD